MKQYVYISGFNPELQDLFPGIKGEEVGAMPGWLYRPTGCGIDAGIKRNNAGFNFLAD